MITVFKNDKEFNNVANEFYSLICDEDIEDINYFFENNENVSDDLNKFFIHCANENDKVDKKMFKMGLQNAIYYLVGVRNEAFVRTLDNSTKLYTLAKDRNDYYEHWLKTFVQVKSMIINVYKKYYDIVIANGDANDLKEMKATYQAICYYLFKLLPKDYQNKLLEKDEFELLTIIKSDFSKPNEFYIKKIDYKLREYILEKYNVDLFEAFYKDQKKSFK